MFCDLVGSTRLSARLDPEELREVINTYRGLVAEAVARFDGHVARYVGDGVLAYFGYPQAHEDDAERAVRAGLMATQSIKKIVNREGIPLDARVGIATGLVVVGNELGSNALLRGDAIGETPNLAARLEAFAAPGKVVVAESTRRLVGRMFECQSLGPVDFKGLPRPVEVWQVSGESSGITRFEALRSETLSPIVGRQRELDLLQRCWLQAKTGQGCVVQLAGEAGIGKSRTIECWLKGVEHEPHTRLRYFCSPHHIHSALHPFIIQIERAAGYGPGSDTHTRLEILGSFLNSLTGFSQQALSLIAELLSMPETSRHPTVHAGPREKREMIFATLLDQLSAFAALQPTVIVFEDAHWSDPTSLDLLDRAVDQIAALPVLVIVTSRPEFRPAWSCKSHVMALNLDRLDHHDGAQLIANVAKCRSLSHSVAQQILERADGIPLFIEELTYSVLETAATHETSGCHSQAAPLPDVTIPLTLQASLVARLDRLGPVKMLAQIASVIGREFPLRLLQPIYRASSEGILRDLHQLVASGLVELRGDTDNHTFIFKHALIRDAAYSSILRSQRRSIHLQLAQLLDTDRGIHSTITEELIATHYENAGEGRLAIAARRRGAEHAMARGSHVEAASLLELAMSDLGMLPSNRERQELELELTMLLVTALSTAHSYAAPEVEQGLLRSRELCTKLDRRDVLFNIEFGLSFSNVVKDDLDRAESFAAQLYVHAEHHDKKPLVDAYLMNGVIQVIRGKFEVGRQLLQEAVDLSDPHRDEPHLFSHGFNPGIYCRAYLAQCLAIMGKVERSLALIDETLELARKRAVDPRHIYSYVSALAIAGRTYMLVGTPEDVSKNSLELIESAGRHQFTYFRDIGHLQQSWALTQMPSVEMKRRGVEELRRALSVLEKTNIGLGIRSFYSQLALAEIELGEKANAIASLAKVTKRTEFGTRSWDAEILRVRGEVSQLPPRPQIDEALRHFNAALEIARNQGAGSFESRAARSCARLLNTLGRFDEARRVLSTSQAGDDGTPIHDFKVYQWLDSAPNRN